MSGFSPAFDRLGAAYAAISAQQQEALVDFLPAADWSADLATGTGCGQLKTGAPARGERIAKYNRLVELADANTDLPYGLAPR